MLTALTIRDFAIVDHLELELASGLSVITGETGAGKSILMDALSLCLGDRSEAGMLRTGADRAEVAATFRISHLPDAQAWLTERELDNGEEAVLRRVIGKDNRSRAFINGSPVTVADLRALGEQLIDIHSQHEHQTLMRRDQHRQMLDAYAGLVANAQQTGKSYQQWREAAQQLDQLSKQGSEQAARLEFLRFQLDELEKLAVAPGEVEAIEAEYDRLSNVDARRGDADNAAQLISGGDNDGVARQIHAATHLLQPHAGDPAVREVLDLLESAGIQISEADHLLRHYTERLEADPERLSELDQRLSTLHQVARKHRINANELPELTLRLSEECAGLTASQDLDALTRRVAELEKDFRKQASALRDKRKKAALEFAARVTTNLHPLGMPNARFEVGFTELEKPAASGLDDIEFLFSANPGQGMKPLAKVASGGELSRVSLAIQVVNAEHSPVPVMVFDEVDVGISGGVAEVVGRLLRKLGEFAQVLCITHQPQVAALGHHHLRVAKSTDGTSTTSSVVALDKKQRIEEIARLSGGLKITSETLKHAKAMLEGA